MMYFKNACLYRFPDGVAPRFNEINDALAKHPARECGPLETQTRGWCTPYSGPEDEIAARIGDHVLMTLGGEDKILPAAVVNKRVAAKANELAQQRGRPVGAKERRRIKDEVMDELLPRALSRPTRTTGFVDLKNGWVVVDSASRSAADGFVAKIREALGSFPAMNLDPEESPRALMTEWMIEGALPEGFRLGEECELQDPADNGAVVRCRRQDLRSEEMREHLTSGKQVTQLELIFDDRLRFVLTEDLALRKIKLLDLAVESLEKNDRGTANAELDARFALLAGEVSRLLARLEDVFGVRRPSMN